MDRPPPGLPGVPGQRRPVTAAMEFIVVLVIAVLVALTLRYRRRANGHPEIPE